MEVRDIFAMRKEGRVVEAYKAISEIYATHQGPHTNLCMFWCCSDMMKLYVKNKDAKGARRMLGQMVKLYPSINDDDHRAARAISKGALAMDQLVENFNLVYFMDMFNKLTNEDWMPYMVNDHYVPSLGQQIVNHLLKDIPNRDEAYLLKVADIFHYAYQKAPRYKLNIRHYAQIQARLGNSDKAVEAYKSLLCRYHDSYLYTELAKLVSDDAQKVALYCQAILHQPREEFRAKYHLELALLFMKQKIFNRAAYELNRCATIRLKYDRPLTPFIKRQMERVKDVEPIDNFDEQSFYNHSKDIVDMMLK